MKVKLEALSMQWDFTINQNGTSKHYLMGPQNKWKFNLKTLSNGTQQ